MSSIDLIDFVTDKLDIHLLPHQKMILRMVEKYPEHNPMMWFRRGDVQSRYIFAWIYKAMWEQYCETGKIELPFNVDTNDEAFKREYECRWNDE